ncbi:Putative alpha/beta hydrolase-3 [Septoria linicola]|uniref:Alpha/beta hydrolase-3 n=1 Tax=Septoria linicola TaxID=215465 RepID=A0A9Q9APZ5_9PEZI|nr:putative alpha/beta hydrolase-3 [Septoria linicola]USW50993.1 Putative alpha/beta hydrolase-3 [Septoria linicola]
MPLESDLHLSSAKFSPSAISPQTQAFNDNLIKVMNAGPKWYEVGAEKYRQMRWNGETPMPRPTVLQEGQNITLPSREAGRNIPCRIFKPENNKTPRGVFYHIHGGGWVLQSEHYQDLMLKRYSDEADLVIVSVGYRLAPENPFPQGNEDCFDVGEYLVVNAEKEFGAKLKFMGGDSAGAHLSVLTTFKLLETRPDFAFAGLVLNFGAYDLSGCLPQAHHFDLPLVLDLDILHKYFAAYLPGKSLDERRDPWISPLYANLNKLKLPPALFTCGTLDLLLDDSVFMSSKWAMSGAESILKIYPGAPHGFSFFPVGGTEQTEECLRDIGIFMNDKLA